MNKKKLLGYVPDRMSEVLSGLTQDVGGKRFLLYKEMKYHISIVRLLIKILFFSACLFFLCGDFVLVRLYNLVSKVTNAWPDIHYLYKVKQISIVSLGTF